MGSRGAHLERQRELSDGILVQACLLAPELVQRLCALGKNTRGFNIPCMKTQAAGATPDIVTYDSPLFRAALGSRTHTDAPRPTGALHTRVLKSRC